MNKTNQVRIFDTTLRDGEQAPGINLNREEKLRIAVQLAKMKVDVIEAGFPAASQGFQAVKQVADAVEGLSSPGSPGRDGRHQGGGRSREGATKGRIHTFIATSPIHMEYKLKMTPAQVIGEVRRR